MLSWGLGNNGDEVPPLNLPLLGLFLFFLLFFFGTVTTVLFERGGYTVAHCSCTSADDKLTNYEPAMTSVHHLRPGRY